MKISFYKPSYERVDGYIARSSEGFNKTVECAAVPRVNDDVVFDGRQYRVYGVMWNVDGDEAEITVVVQ